MKPKFVSSPDLFRQWLEKKHASAKELLVGFHKKDSGKKSITYAEALDEALCYGWIDGVRRSINETSYTIRFTPRKPRSIWSLVNVKHVERLQKAGRMEPPGLAAYAQRDPKRTGIYAFENAPRDLAAEYEKELRKHAFEDAVAIDHQKPSDRLALLDLLPQSGRRKFCRLRGELTD